MEGVTNLITRRNDPLDDKLCCTAAAANKIKQLTIGGRLVGIDRLDDIISEVEAMRLKDDVQIGEAILKRVKIFNYVPSSVASKYIRALLEEYRRRG